MNSANKSKDKIKGWKKVNRPTANSASSSDVLSFHTSFEDVTASASATSSQSSEWALHDTGATHHVFKNQEFFDNASFKLNKGLSKRSKLAGGNVSLNVKGMGVVKLKAGNGSTFELKECLWVPDRSRNLIAGGLLKSKGVREMYDDHEPTSFALVKGDLAIFNGYIGTDNLMHLLLERVSPRTLPSVSVVTDSDIVHRRLGHLSNQYLEAMCQNNRVIGCWDMEDKSNWCDTCSLAKGTKIPHNHTRPRAVQFLENVHVDLSGIMQTTGLKNESYYILFTDDFSTYRHIYPLNDKTKEEVHEVFVSYIALSERQTGCKLKQFTLDRGGEFVNSLLGETLTNL